MKNEKCVGKNCHHEFPTEDVHNDNNVNATWNEGIDDGYLCDKCAVYLSVAEDINDTMNSHNMEIDFEYCIDCAYMLIDTYKSYKQTKEL